MSIVCRQRADIVLQIFYLGSQLFDRFRAHQFALLGLGIAPDKKAMSILGRGDRRGSAAGHLVWRLTRESHIDV